MEPMRALARFTRDRSGSMLAGYAGVAAFVAAISVFATWSLDQMTRGGGAVSPLGVMAARSPRSNQGHTVLSQTTVDFTPTGSIPSNLAAPVVLDPCTGARKN